MNADSQDHRDGFARQRASDFNLSIAQLEPIAPKAVDYKVLLVLGLSRFTRAYEPNSPQLVGGEHLSDS